MRNYIAVTTVNQILRAFGVENEQIREAVRAKSRTDLVPIITCDRCKYGTEIESKDDLPGYPNNRAWGVYECRLHHFRR